MTETNAFLKEAPFNPRMIEHSFFQALTTRLAPGQMQSLHLKETEIDCLVLDMSERGKSLTPIVHWWDIGMGESSNKLLLPLSAKGYQGTWRQSTSNAADLLRHHPLAVKRCWET